MIYCLHCRHLPGSEDLESHDLPHDLGCWVSLLWACLLYADLSDPDTFILRSQLLQQLLENHHRAAVRANRSRSSSEAEVIQGLELVQRVMSQVLSDVESLVLKEYEEVSKGNIDNLFSCFFKMMSNSFVFQCLDFFQTYYLICSMFTLFKE